MSTPMTAVYRIETPRLVVRCWNPSDAPLLQDAVVASLEQLRTWMPWAREEPMSLSKRVEGCRSNRARFDTDQDYVYGIFDRDERIVLGGTGLHKRLGPNALEIGYWIRTEHVRRGYCAEATSALCRVAFCVYGVERVEIHCDPNNAASARVPLKLGFRHDATLRRRAQTPQGAPRDTMVWSLFADEFAASAAANVEVVAKDACGDVIPAV